MIDSEFAIDVGRSSGTEILNKNRCTRQWLMRLIIFNAACNAVLGKKDGRPKEEGQQQKKFEGDAGVHGKRKSILPKASKFFVMEDTGLIYPNQFAKSASIS